MLHKIVQVYPTKDYTVYLYFIDGRIKLFNAKELISKGVFQKLQDIDLFMNSCTVLNDTLAWDINGNMNPYDCLDLDPEELFNSCQEIPDPCITHTA